jgi:hypothetical protein
MVESLGCRDVVSVTLLQFGLSLLCNFFHFWCTPNVYWLTKTILNSSSAQVALLFTVR